MFSNPYGNDNSEKKELLSLFLKNDSFRNEKFPELSQAREFEAKVPVFVLICCICLLGIILLSKVVKNYLIEKIL